MKEILSESCQITVLSGLMIAFMKMWQVQKKKERKKENTRRNINWSLEKKENTRGTVNRFKKSSIFSFRYFLLMMWFSISFQFCSCLDLVFLA